MFGCFGLICKWRGANATSWVSLESVGGAFNRWGCVEGSIDETVDEEEGGSAPKLGDLSASG